MWLENYLSTYDRCLIVVSHSQDFLNGVCTNVIHITPKRKLQVYGGNYDTFVQVKTENEVNQMKKYNKEQDDIKHLKAFIASCGTYSNLVRQGKSKQKIIDKMVAAGLTDMVESEPVFNFHFPSVDPLPPPVLAFQDVAFAYSGDMKDALYSRLKLGVTMDSRVALVGPNGAGKSTLLKLMVGDLAPTLGTIRKHLDLSVSRYNQHSNEQLDPNMSPLDFIRHKFPDKKMSEEDWRQQLGKFGVRGAQQTAAIGKMSDGQKSRLVFCLMSVTRPNFLVLDEPTSKFISSPPSHTHTHLSFLLLLALVIPSPISFFLLNLSFFAPLLFERNSVFFGLALLLNSRFLFFLNSRVFFF